MFEFYERILSKGRFNAVKEEYNELLYVPDPDNLLGLTTFSNFILGTSKIEAMKVLASMETAIDGQITLEAQKLKLKKFLGEFDNYIKRLDEDDFFKGEYSYFQTDLATKKNELEAKYSFLINENVLSPNTSNTIPHKNKIQWLGKTNVLATLIYDLWKGQEKGKGEASMPQLLKADKKDLEQLLIDNFIDSNGKPLSISTISDYLNSAKPEKRAKKGSRIEL